MRDEEHRIQVAGVELCRKVFPVCRDLLYAVPNGGPRTTRKYFSKTKQKWIAWSPSARRLKDEGVLAGVFDLALDVTKIREASKEELEIFSGLKIEVKTPEQYRKKNHGLSPAQLRYKAAVEEQGYKTAIVCSAQQLFDVVREYLEG